MRLNTSAGETRPLLFNQASRTNFQSCGRRSLGLAAALLFRVDAAHDLEARCRC